MLIVYDQGVSSRNQSVVLVHTDLELIAFSPDLIRMLRTIGLRGLGRLSVIAQTEHVGNDVSGTSRTAFGLHPQGHLDVRLALRIRVVLWIFAKSLLTTG